MSDFPKKLGVFKDNFSKSDYDEMNRFYRQLRTANFENATIKNTIKDVKIFKKMLRHYPISVPLAIEFYILIMSMMLCNDYFFNFFRKYYFDLLFDYNLTDEILDDIKNNNNKIGKSCISYKIYKSLIEKKNNSNSIDIPIKILDDVSFKIKIVEKMYSRNIEYTKKIKNSINNGELNVNIDINNVIKQMNDIKNISISNINSNEIPDKLVIYVNVNSPDKDLIKYYKNPIIVNFDASKVYEEDKMNDVKLNYFKDKNAFKTLIGRFNPPNIITNIYDAEISNDNKLGIVDNNILLTVKKCFQINEKIKLNNGKIYTIVEVKWPPGSWIKNKFSEIDKIDKIKNISKKKIKSYEITKDVIIEKLPNNIELLNSTYSPVQQKYDSDIFVLLLTNFERFNVGLTKIKKKNIKIIFDETQLKLVSNLKKYNNYNIFNVYKFFNSSIKVIQTTPTYDLKTKKINLNNFNLETFINMFGNFFYKCNKNVFYILPLDINMAIISNGNENTFKLGNYNYELYYNEFNMSDENIEKIIKNNGINDVKYNDNLKKIYNDIKNNKDQDKNKKDKLNFLKFQLIFLKTCYNYYKLYKETGNEFNKLLIEINNEIYDDPILIRKKCIKLYYLKYLHECRKLVYNYYLYGFHWWIIVAIEYYNNNVKFTKEKIIANNYFFNNPKMSIDQEHYNLMNDMKKELYFKIFNSLFELNNFYANNKTIEIFSQNLLMDILFQKQDKSSNLLIHELYHEINFSINADTDSREEISSTIANEPNSVASTITDVRSRSDSSISDLSSDLDIDSLNSYTSTISDLSSDLDIDSLNSYTSTISDLSSISNISDSSISGRSSNMSDSSISERSSNISDSSISDSSAEMRFRYEGGYKKKYNVVYVEDNKNAFFNSCIHALKNKLDTDDFLNNKNIINILNNQELDTSKTYIKYNNVSKLRQAVINSFEFNYEYNVIKKEFKTMQDVIEKNGDNNISIFLKKYFSLGNEEIKNIIGEKISDNIDDYDENVSNYLKNDNADIGYFIIGIVSKIFNCMIYDYDDENENTIRSVSTYENQKYTIILYNKKHVISYDNNISMTCIELPEWLQIYQYCYQRKPKEDALSGGSQLIGGTIEIDEIKSNIDSKMPNIMSAERTILLYNNEINRTLEELKKETTDLEKRENLKNKINQRKNDMQNINARLVKYYDEIIKKYDELIKKYEDQVPINPKQLNDAINLRDSYKNKMNNINNKINEEKEKNKKVYGIIVNLILYPGENPNILDKQTYKCKNSFEELKKEYCEVFGIGCDENKKIGGTRKNKNKSKKYTMKKNIL